MRESDVGADGLIGIDALTEQRLMMDFEAHQVRVEDARKPMKFSPDDIVIIARRTRGQLILTEVRASGFPLDAVIDTGSEICVGNEALRQRLFGGRQTDGKGMAGTAGARVCREQGRKRPERHLGEHESEGAGEVERR